MNKNIRNALITVAAIVGILLICSLLVTRTANRGVAGFDKEDVTAAQFRWALFEEWARTQPQYKGWESDPEIFKKANEDYKSKINPNVQVLK